jgi:hypothetical protein
MNGLMMHCGAEPIKYPELQVVGTPERTDTHFPIAHHQFFDMAERRLREQGYQLQNTRHYINREGAHYFALTEIHHEEEDYDQDHSTMCALRNTHDKTFAASLAIGARVFVCDNLSFSGDIVVGRKHTANIWDELPDRFDGAIGKIRVMRKHQDIRFAEYKEAPLDNYTADHLIMETWRQGIINLKRLKAVHERWTGDEVHGDKTVWRFFNACTGALAPPSTAALMTLPKKTIDLHLLLDNYCNVDFTEPEAEPAGFIDRIRNKVLN